MCIVLVCAYVCVGACTKIMALDSILKNCASADCHRWVAVAPLDGDVCLSDSVILTSYMFLSWDRGAVAETDEWMEGDAVFFSVNMR